MMNAIKFTAALTAMLMIMSLAGCSGDKGGETSSEITSSAVQSQPPTADDVRKNVIGDWGRLGEVMHEFYSDNTCIIGGMFGDYEITDDLTLVLISTGGTRTEYAWNAPTQQNYWLLDGETLTVNGNQFTKIVEETEEQP